MEVDFVVGTVPFDSAEESVVRKLALDRLLRSLKKGMLSTWSKRDVLKDHVEDAFGKSGRLGGGWLRVAVHRQAMYQNWVGFKRVTAQLAQRRRYQQLDGRDSGTITTRFPLG